ncbi:MAG TPA: SOS response-associated peptidase [Usitatibacter sp.]|nr:SOS response-associated peptidase [Usitatibacter sp.]
MCSRYFLDADGNIIAYTFRVPVNGPVHKRFNIAPTQVAPVVRVGRDGARELAMLRWGLVPPWAGDLKAGTRMINARAEGIETRPAFREAVKARRCIVPATGFYEWQGEPGRKQPYAITVPGEKLFAFAGLWESWRPRGEKGAEPVQTFTIVTTDANPQVARIHDRMPVILPPEAIDIWLHAPAEEALKVLSPYATPVDLRAVGRHVSNVNNEGPECLDDPAPAWDEPKQDERQGKLL